MNRIIRAFAAFIVSICLILAPAISYAASPNGWAASPADIIMNGASATINAVKGSGSSALQSTIKYAPTAGRAAKHIVKVGGVFAVGMAITQILGDGVDYVLDPANNRVKYKVPAPENTKYLWESYDARKLYASPADACRDFYRSYGKGDGRYAGNPSDGGAGTILHCYMEGATSTNHWITKRPNPAYDPTKPDEEKYIPYSQVAQKIISNAASGEPQSQEFIKTIAVEDLESGALDVPLNTNAVPKADNPPVTDPNNPPVTDPDAPVPFDPSSIIAAIKSVMAAVVNMSGVLGAKIDALMIDLGLKQAETIEAITAGTGEIVAANDRTGAKVAEMVAAIEALEGNTLDGQVINDAVDRVIANDNVKVGDIVAAIEAIEGNTLDGQVINDAVDRVIANDNVNAQSAADAATAAADAATAADAANTATVTDAIGAQTDAITEADPVTGEMFLKFPKFCSWAVPVCTFTDWAMADPQLEEPEDTRPEIQDLTKYDTVDISQNYITASGQCPPAVDLNINFGVVKLSYEPLCLILDKLSGVIVAVAYISVGFMIIRTV